MYPISAKHLALAICAALSTSAMAASFDVSDLDARISPCADFNGFVNAKWVAANPIPADRTRWGAFDALREQSLNTQHEIVEAAARNADKAAAGSIEQKIGWFYHAGMDEAAIEKAGLTPLKPELDRIAALKTPQDIARYITDSHARGEGGMFMFGAGADFKNSKVQIAFAMQGGLALPTSEYYSKPEYKEVRNAYLAHVAKILQLGGANAADAKRDADRVLAFETRLASASLTPVEWRKPENQYHFVSLADADKASPNFSWSKFFAAQHADIQGGFSLSQPKFFAEFDKMLVDVPVSHWQAYFRAHAIDGAAPYLSKAFADESFAFYKSKLNGQKEQEPRWKRVLGATNETMGMALGELYVAKAFPPESKARALELVNNVVAALKTRIEGLDWMSAETKKKALEKWASFLPKIGYPDKWRDWSGLQLKPDDYFGNILAAARFNHDWDVAKIGKPTDRLEWGMTPQTVNAYYNPTDNTINFPAAILQAPFFDAKADDALNYGGIGAVIGHEATHGFDDEGSQFDAQGNNVNWWSKDDRAKFDARTDKLVKQFNAYEALPGKHVNGQLTLGENIADLGGLNVAWDAFQKVLKTHPQENHKIDGYTPDQRFFLNWARVWRGSVRPERAQVMLNADPHAPTQFRAIAAPSNMPQFASTFACKPGDAMVRGGDAQVKIW
ncbi:M13 family metallopeptidase [Dokdonella sp.]|uniref:M13 family metallopeptidase n=1 Tax=Dokdonella sp. TaxID=2291710 RepID=UPI0025BF993A|nr:M13 family metallopeptidase [Dokdonella sp.]MBX3689047.1 M13 family metallopeptidase [Dokdonella sp.]